MVDNNIFKESLKMLMAVYGHNLTKEVYSVYYSILSPKMNNEEFLKAIQSIMETFKPTSQVKFPLVPDFLSSIGKAGIPRAKQAISDLKFAVRRFGRYDSVNFGDSKLHQTVIFYGGWTEICKWDDRDWGMKEKSFIDTYNSMQENHKYDHLAGIHEANNSGRFNVEPPKLVYEVQGKRPFEVLEYKPSVPMIAYKSREGEQLDINNVSEEILTMIGGLDG